MLFRIYSYWSDRPIAAVITLVAIAVVAVVSEWVFVSHMEAGAFNRITGEQVSTWDAMWVHLRVDRPMQVPRSE